MRLKRTIEYLKIGQYLQLNQKLKSGESGWAESRIDLPDSRSIPFVKFNQVGELLLQTKEGTTYFLSPINFGQIRFEILDKGKKTEGELISIWNKLAKKEKNSRITTRVKRTSLGRHSLCLRKACAGAPTHLSVPARRSGPRSPLTRALYGLRISEMKMEIVWPSAIGETRKWENALPSAASKAGL